MLYQLGNTTLFEHQAVFYEKGYLIGVFYEYQGSPVRVQDLRTDGINFWSYACRLPVTYTIRTPHTAEIQKFKCPDVREYFLVPGYVPTSTGVVLPTIFEPPNVHLNVRETANARRTVAG